ncbi:MAG: ISAzo13-like element transposase-related protein [Vibrio fluvialis]
MDSGVTDELLRVAARALTGRDRRVFQAQACLALCGGSARKAEERFGWGRANVAFGLREFTEQEPGQIQPPASPRGRLRSEEKNPQLAKDIRLIVEPHTQSDPELKSSRQYTNLSAAEVREQLVAKGYEESQLPSERTIRDILNRMNYRLKRIQKGKPLKKTKDTDAIFENVKAARQKYADDPETLEISVDTKTKVQLGEYSMGGKNTDRQRRQRPASSRS